MNYDDILKRERSPAATLRLYKKDRKVYQSPSV